MRGPVCLLLILLGTNLSHSAEQSLADQALFLVEDYTVDQGKRKPYADFRMQALGLWTGAELKQFAHCDLPHPDYGLDQPATQKDACRVPDDPAYVRTIAAVFKGRAYPIYHLGRRFGEATTDAFDKSSPQETRGHYSASSRILYAPVRVVFDAGNERPDLQIRNYDTGGPDDSRESRPLLATRLKVAPPKGWKRMPITPQELKQLERYARQRFARVMGKKVLLDRHSPQYSFAETFTIDGRRVQFAAFTFAEPGDSWDGWSVSFALGLDGPGKLTVFQNWDKVGTDPYPWPRRLIDVEDFDADGSVELIFDAYLGYPYPNARTEVWRRAGGEWRSVGQTPNPMH